MKMLNKNIKMKKIKLQHKPSNALNLSNKELRKHAEIIAGPEQD